MEIKLPDELCCKRCGYTWIPRIRDVRICPKCKSARWNEEPRKGKVHVKHRKSKSVGSGE